MELGALVLSYVYQLIRVYKSSINERVAVLPRKIFSYILFGFIFLNASLVFALEKTQEMNSQETAIYAESLAKKNVCLSCHQINKKRVGPSFRAIALRYKDAGEKILKYLSDSIKSGGKGRWGVIPMPEQNHISEKEALIITKWIRSLANSDNENKNAATDKD